MLPSNTTTHPGAGSELAYLHSWYIVSCTVESSEESISFWVDLTMWGVSGVSLVLGLPLHLILVHYEWYGGDSQKRSLGNRIITQCAIANLLWGW